MTTGAVRFFDLFYIAACVRQITSTVDQLPPHRDFFLSSFFHFSEIASTVDPLPPPFKMFDVRSSREIQVYGLEASERLYC